MLGMVKKEIFMIKNNMKAIITALVIYAFYSFMFNMNLTGFLPMMMAMISISTFSYDDYNNWHAYLATMPNGKKNAVLAKYLVTIITMILSTIIAIGLTYIFSMINNQITFDTNIEMLFGSIFAIVVIIAIIFPFMFKYQSEKGRLVMVLVGLTIAGVALLPGNCKGTLQICKIPLQRKSVLRG